MTEDEFRQTDSTVSPYNNPREPSTTETSSDAASSNEAPAKIEHTTYTTVNDSMFTDSMDIQNTLKETSGEELVTDGIISEYVTDETDTYSSTESETWREVSEFTHQMKADVTTTTEIHWLEVTTQSGPNVSNFQEGVDITDNIVAESQVDCNSVIILMSSAFAVVLLLVSIGCLCGLWKIRRTWRRKFDEEKRKTNIWTKENTDNTIVNENYEFNDIEIRTQSDENLRQPEIDQSLSTSGAQLSSAKARGSTASIGSRLSKVLPSKLFIGRSKSSYSDESLSVKDPQARGRASTFAHGKRIKIKRDTDKLVDHIETEEPRGILESVDNILKPQNKHIVTEL